MRNRFMRLILMFDLPTNTSTDKKNYNTFKKHIVNLGFCMLQYSIYTRIVKNNDYADKYIHRLKYNIPPKGSIRLLKITEKQYSNMLILQGNITYSEQLLENINQIIDL